MKTSQTELARELTYTRFDRMSQKYPKQTAVVYLGQGFSYEELRDLSLCFAGALKDMGIQKGDRIIIYVSNCIQWLIAFLGIQRLGAVIVPVSPIYTSFEIEYMLNDSGAETIICLDTNFSYVQEDFETTGLKRAIVTNLVELLPWWKRALGFLLNKGNTVLLMPIPQVDAILETVQRYRARWILGVPALYRMILENDRLDLYDLSSLTYCYCGGDVLPMEVFKRWKELFRVPIYQVYGSTEAGHVTYSSLDTEPDPKTIGFPLASRECLVVDPATLDILPPGENGELLVTSPYTLKQYLNKPEETKRSYVTVQDKVYYRMGDFVRQNEDGQLEYVERSADIIKHKGYRVSASEVEVVLQDHSTVLDACVVGIPDQKVGERIKAIVVMKEATRGVGGSELHKWCRERLAAYKVPAYIEFRDMLPKSKVGKLLRREIRDEEGRRMAKDQNSGA